jgi:hypothetical protein
MWFAAFGAALDRKKDLAVFFLRSPIAMLEL